MVIEFDDLRQAGRGTVFEGDQHSGLGLSFFLVDGQEPGGGPPLHWHPYPEVLVVLDGTAGVQVGDEELEAHEGPIVIAPARVPHRFWNAVAGRLRMVNVHPSPHVVQTWVQLAEQEVSDLAQSWAMAERAADAAALAPLLAGDFQLVGPLGFTVTKEQFLDSRRSGDLRHRALTLEDLGVRTYGEAAVAVGVLTQESSYRDHDASGRFRLTLIAARQGETWVIAGLHLSATAAQGERS